MVTKDQPTESNTGYAQGGVAVAMGADDATELHLEDTLGAGAGHRLRARRARAGRRGAGADPRARGLGRPLRPRGRPVPLHARRRPLAQPRPARPRRRHRVGDGARAPRPRAADRAGDRALLRLLGGPRRRRRRGGGLPLPRRDRERRRRCWPGPPCWPREARDRCSRRRPIRRWRPATAWPWPGARGRHLLDMEFVQFHPTALAVPGAPRFLVSEAVRGEGAYLRNAHGGAVHGRAGRRATRWRAPSRARRGRGAGPVTLDLAPSRPRAHPQPLPAHRRHLRTLRGRPHPRSGAGDAGRPLRDGRRGHRPARAVHAARPLRGGGGRGHRRARRQPPGQQLAARGARLRRPRGGGDDRGCQRRRSAAVRRPAPPAAEDRRARGRRSRRRGGAAAPARVGEPRPRTRRRRPARPARPIWPSSGRRSTHAPADRASAEARNLVGGGPGHGVGRALPRGEPGRPFPHRFPGARTTSASSGTRCSRRTVPRLLAVDASPVGEAR